VISRVSGAVAAAVVLLAVRAPARADERVTSPDGGAADVPATTSIASDGAASAPPPPAPTAAPPESPPAPPAPPRAPLTTRPAPPPAFQTTVTGPEPAASAPREDRAAAASVVLPSASPRAYDDLGTLLLEVPGVTVARTGSSEAFSSITLRGSNPDQVSIYVDGVPLNIAEGGGVDVSTLPLGDVERVEVYRGTTPLAFGEAALGGIISITTRTPSLTQANVRAGVGSYGTVFADASGGGQVGRLRLYLGTHLFSTKGNYPFRSDNLTPANPADDYDTFRQNNDAREGNGVFRAILTLAGRRTLGLGVVAFAREQGLPGSTTLPALHARFHTERGLGYLRYESRDDLGPGGRLSAEAFVSVERDRLIDPYGEVEDQGAMTTHETTSSIGATAHATRPLDDWARAALLLEGRRERYTPTDELEPAMSGVPARRLVGVAGAEIDVRWQRLDLDVIPSARIEGMDDIVAGQSTSATPLPAGPAITRLLPTFRLALLRPVSRIATLKANIGRYGHAPSFLELYGDGSQRLLGNPRLVPETGTNADLALWIDRSGDWVAVTSRTTVFGSLADDLIYWPRTSDGPSRAQNLAEARVYGVEQELRMRLGPHLRLIAEATYTVADDESENATTHGKQIPHHPRITAYARPELVRVRLPAGLDFAAYTDAALFGGGYDDPANVYRIPTQVLVGAGMGVRWPRAHLRLTASGVNLTNLSTWNFTTWPLPGRAVFLALAYDSTGASATDAFGSQPFTNL
jgi:outer membrane cobalamin receptor